MREGERAADLLDLGVATDEARQPSGGCDMEPASLGAGSGERIDLHGVGQALDRDRSPCHDLYVTFGALKRGGGKQDGAGRRHLLHTGREMRRLTDGGVVHVQVGPDGADDDVARVEAHADLDGYSLQAENFLRVLRN